MARVSKNSRMGIKTQILTHNNCGGVVKMKGVFDKKLRWHAECEECGATARKPTELGIS